MERFPTNTVSLRDIVRFKVTTKIPRRIHCNLKFTRNQNREWVRHILDCEECFNRLSTRPRVLYTATHEVRHGLGGTEDKAIALREIGVIPTEVLARVITHTPKALTAYDLKMTPMAYLVR